MHFFSAHHKLFSFFFVTITISGCSDAAERTATSGDTVTLSQPDTAPSSDSAAISPISQLDCTPSASANDRMICPHRIGPITRSTSREQLATLFPGAALVDTTVHVGEGQFEPGTILSANGDSLSIVWADTARDRIVGFTGVGKTWQTTGGLRVGSSLAEMERVLGSFAVMGFGWDYGGTAMLANTPLQDSGIFFRMQPRFVSARATPAYQRVRGERQYPTSSADVRALDLIVRAIDINWR